jgi:hypothetical protein
LKNACVHANNMGSTSVHMRCFLWNSGACLESQQRANEVPFGACMGHCRHGMMHVH